MGNILSFSRWLAHVWRVFIWPRAAADRVPLDLQQVEVIKGANSTLYGGGAIAGLVNLVTKKPGIEPETSMLLNATSAGGLDASGFHTSSKEVWGREFLPLITRAMPTIRQITGLVLFRNSSVGL